VDTVFWWRNTRKKATWKTRRRWEENIEMYLQEVVLGYMDWIVVAKDGDRWRAVLKAVLNIWME
jgi:hypothetical protein